MIAPCGRWASFRRGLQRRRRRRQHVKGRPISRSDRTAARQQSYLDIDAVVAAAVRTGAGAVHPGYGFLSENADFAAALRSVGVVFIRPPAAAIATMGDKMQPKAAVSAFSVPVVPGIAEPGLADADLIGAAVAVGFPVLVKPSAGGGEGMRRVDGPADLPAALASSAARRRPPFGDDAPCSSERFVLRLGISRCRCSPMRTATCHLGSGNAVCSAGTRR